MKHDQNTKDECSWQYFFPKWFSVRHIICFLQYLQNRYFFCCKYSTIFISTITTALLYVLWYWYVGKESKRSGFKASHQLQTGKQNLLMIIELVSDLLDIIPLSFLFTFKSFNFQCGVQISSNLCDYLHLNFSWFIILTE